MPLPPWPFVPWQVWQLFLYTCWPRARTGSLGVAEPPELPHATSTNADTATTTITVTARILVTIGDRTARVRCTEGNGSGDTERMGFNPHRQHRRSPLDYVMVGAALVVCLGLVIWAVIG